MIHSSLDTDDDSTQVVKTSVNVITNSPSQDYTHPDDHNLPTHDSVSIYQIQKHWKQFFFHGEWHPTKRCAVSFFSYTCSLKNHESTVSLKLYYRQKFPQNEL